MQYWNYEMVNESYKFFSLAWWSWINSIDIWQKDYVFLILFLLVLSFIEYSRSVFGYRLLYLSVSGSNDSNYDPTSHILYPILFLWLLNTGTKDGGECGREFRESTHWNRGLYQVLRLPFYASRQQYLHSTPTRKLTSILHFSYTYFPIIYSYI